MRKSAATFFACCAVVTLLLTGCGLFAALQRTEQASTGLSVVTSIFPLTCIAREIGGDRVDITTLLPAGGSAHLHEVGPSAMREAARADVLIRIAGGLDQWAGGVFRAAGEGAVRLEIGTVLGKRGREPPGGSDPHIWLDPVLVRDDILPLLVETLAGADPEGREYYEENAARFTGDLTELHEELADMLSDAAGRSFIADHAAWTHFAHRYQLEQRGVLEFTPGHECGPREAADLVDLARLERISVITTTRGHGTMLAEALAGQIDGIIVELDPLGDPASEDRNSYTSILRYNAARLARALRGAVAP